MHPIMFPFLNLAMLVCVWVWVCACARAICLHCFVEVSVDCLMLCDCFMLCVFYSRLDVLYVFCGFFGCFLLWLFVCVFVCLYCVLFFLFFFLCVFLKGVWGCVCERSLD